MARIAVCFVCLGNICRSPTAEAVFRRLVEVAGLVDDIEIDSAGTAAYHVGERADPRSRAAAQARGYDVTSVARQFHARDFETFDYVLAMDEANLRDLERTLKSTGRKSGEGPVVRLFRDFEAGVGSAANVPDPYYGGADGFSEVLDICERAGEGLLAHLREELSSD